MPVNTSYNLIAFFSIQIFNSSYQRIVMEFDDTPEQFSCTSELVAAGGTVILQFWNFHLE